MEIYDESLVYYALRDEEGNYFNRGDKVSLKDCTMFESRDVVEEIQTFYTEFTQIRKVKVIDIGE